MPLTILVILGLSVPLVLMVLSKICERAAMQQGDTVSTKNVPFECGLSSVVGSAEENFSVKFYLIAMLFLVFDLEVAFLYPFAIQYMEVEGWGMFAVLIVFLLMLEAGYLYLFKKGALDWDK
ncbi:MAG: NADH-quinone oxidoreductase subunit A [Planctomycetes bacterium]|nr:NADH-quinone oxidoreductase subunit A [Planctomycetota bacterium]